MISRKWWHLIFIFGFTFSCLQTTYVGNKYGDRVSYGTHCGIDYSLEIGTPIIACSDGEVLAIYEPGNAIYMGGTSIRILHRSDSGAEPAIISIYAHLSRTMVRQFEKVKRGQLIGLSGESNNGYPHLHFQLMKPGTLGEMKFSNTYNPTKFAIDDRLDCFDPSRDYSGFSEIEITLPIACGDYKKQLVEQWRQE